MNATVHANVHASVNPNVNVHDNVTWNEFVNLSVEVNAYVMCECECPLKAAVHMSEDVNQPTSVHVIVTDNLTLKEITKGYRICLCTYEYP